MSFDPAQRAFVVARPSEPANTPLTIQIDSSTERPLVNPAIVIERLGAQAKIRVSVDGKQSMAPVRFGIEHHVDGDDAVAYVEMTATPPVEIRVEPRSR